MAKRDEELLLEKIQEIRHQIVSTFEKSRSFADPAVYALSVELDQLINQYQKILMKKRNSERI